MILLALQNPTGNITRVYPSRSPGYIIIPVYYLHIHLYLQLLPHYVGTSAVAQQNLDCLMSLQHNGGTSSPLTSGQLKPNPLCLGCKPQLIWVGAVQKAPWLIKKIIYINTIITLLYLVSILLNLKQFACFINCIHSNDYCTFWVIPSLLNTLSVPLAKASAKIQLMII